MSNLYSFIIILSVSAGAFFLFDGNVKSDTMLIDSQESGSQVFEMRTYTTHEGKLDALHQRFSDHTMRIFEKHGMKNIGYWVPTDPELSENTLIYIISHESREAARRSWDAFRSDPEWQEVYEASHADGVIVSNVESVFMESTPYSPIK
jgi:hypothetical protein